MTNVNAIDHFTDWIVAHVHVGALGWNGFLTFGILYWLIPRLYRTDRYSNKLANFHFWIGTLGIVFYAVPMYWGGITQSLMWKQFTPEGILQYPNFLETVVKLIPLYITRAIGGTLYFTGVLVMVYNLIKTAKQGQFEDNEATEAPPMIGDHAAQTKHKWLESRPGKFALLSAVVILIGGLVQMIPTFLIKSNIPTISSVKPYTPLELQGRDIYIREGCNNCH